MKENKLLRIMIVVSLIFLLLTINFRFTPAPKQTPKLTQSVTTQLLARGYSISEVQAIQAQLPLETILKLSTQPYQKDVVENEINPFYNTFKELGYTNQDIKSLKIFNSEVLNYIVNSAKIENLQAWLNADYFISDRFIRYLDYHQKYPQQSLRSVVEHVNADRDQVGYSQTQAVDFNKKVILVNKFHYLSQSYIPKDLSKAQGCGQPTLRKEAALAYDLMCQAITKARLLLLEATSSYRSYGYQASLYNSYLKQYGRTYTDTFSARPGFSEHQTGLAIDVHAENHEFDSFVSTETYQWMIQNAARFGFILRYPKGKEDITGYQFEAWHYRYVGIDLALQLQTQGITLDEAVLFIE